MTPGETLLTEMWKVAEDKIIFQVKVKERDVVVISNGVVNAVSGSIKVPAKTKAAL